MNWIKEYTMSSEKNSIVWDFVELVSEDFKIMNKDNGKVRNTNTIGYKKISKEV